MRHYITYDNRHICYDSIAGPNEDISCIRICPKQKLSEDDHVSLYHLKLHFIQKHLKMI